MSDSKFGTTYVAAHGPEGWAVIEITNEKGKATTTKIIGRFDEQHHADSFARFMDLRSDVVEAWAQHTDSPTAKEPPK